MDVFLMGLMNDLDMMAFVKLHLPYMMCMKIAIKWVILIGT